MHDVALGQEKLGQINAILAGNARYERGLASRLGHSSQLKIHMGKVTAITRVEWLLTQFCFCAHAFLALHNRNHGFSQDWNASDSHVIYLLGACFLQQSAECVY